MSLTSYRTAPPRVIRVGPGTDRTDQDSGRRAAPLSAAPVEKSSLVWPPEGRLCLAGLAATDSPAP